MEYFPQPPLTHATTNAELSPGDRVEGLGNFGTPTGQMGTVEQANEDDVVVKWDDDGRMKLRQRWLKKIVASNKSAVPLQPKSRVG